MPRFRDCWPAWSRPRAPALLLPLGRNPILTFGDSERQIGWTFPPPVPSGCGVDDNLVVAGSRTPLAAAAAVVLLAGRLPAASGGSCVISGRVFDDRGNPLRTAVVNAVRRQFSAGEFMAGGASTGERGEYCIRGLPPGEYLVRATARTAPVPASPSCRSCCLPHDGPASDVLPPSFRAGPCHSGGGGPGPPFIRHRHPDSPPAGLLRPRRGQGFEGLLAGPCGDFHGTGAMVYRRY